MLLAEKILKRHPAVNRENKNTAADFVIFYF